MKILKFPLLFVLLWRCSSKEMILELEVKRSGFKDGFQIIFSDTYTLDGQADKIKQGEQLVKIKRASAMIDGHV